MWRGSRLTYNLLYMLRLTWFYWVSYTISLIVFIVVAIILSLIGVSDNVILGIALVIAINIFLTRYARCNNVENVYDKDKSMDFIKGSSSPYKIGFNPSFGRMGSIGSNYSVYLPYLNTLSALLWDYTFVFLGVIISVGFFDKLMFTIIDASISFAPIKGYFLLICIFISFILFHKRFSKYRVHVHEPLALRMLVALVDGILWFRTLWIRTSRG